MPADREPDVDLAEVREHIKEAKEAAGKAHLADPPETEVVPDPEAPHRQPSSPSDA